MHFDPDGSSYDIKYYVQIPVTYVPHEFKFTLALSE